MNNRIDQIAMLLSTDWFADKWHLLGIQSDLLRCQKMKQKCRGLVDDLFGNELDYWLVSFEEVRIESTRKKFFSATVECSLEAQDIDRFNRILEDSEWEMNDASILENLTRLLSANPDDETLEGLPRRLAEKVANIWAKVDAPIDLKAELNASTTQWDLDIQKRTPGLPEYLGDFAISVCSKLSFFQQFWSHAMQNISKDERDKLLSWYRRMAQELAGVQIIFG